MFITLALTNAAQKARWEGKGDKENLVMLWNIINTFLAAVGIGLAIWGISYGRQQFELSKQQDEAKEASERRCGMVGKIWSG